MRLGIPGQVIRIAGRLPGAAITGEQRKVDVGMLPEGASAPGARVIIHMGFVAERTDRANAEQAMAGLELIGRGRGAPGGG